MLERLEIDNFALIEHLEMDFSSGFNVISGETGSGKSIILGALGLLLGEKADVDAIRSGAEELTVNGVFTLEKPSERALELFDELGIDISSKDLSIRRVVKANGRSIVRIQGESMSLKDLAAIGAVLVDVHGQSDHQSLLSHDRQREVVDAFSGNIIVFEAYTSAYNRWTEAEERYFSLKKACEEAGKKADYLEYAVKEIENINPKPDEDEQLKAEILKLSSFSKIMESVSFIRDSLAYSSPKLADAAASALKACSFDSDLKEVADRLEAVQIECSDIRDSLAQKYDISSFSEDRLDSLQARQNDLGRLKRKYGGSIESVLSFFEEAKKELAMAQSGEEKLKHASSELSQATADLDKNGKQLSEVRKTTGKKLSEEVVSHLRDLGMPDVRFEVAVEPKDYSENGGDSVEMLIGANLGEAMRPIRQVASGGELSRIMLAIKSVLAEADDIHTQVFDEVDAGIGGNIALSVGMRLKELSRTRQVVAVTHLASVASLADTQMVVSKHVAGGRTFTCVTNTEGEDRVAEIARMLSGDSQNPVSVEHARSLLCNGGRV